MQSNLSLNALSPSHQQTNLPAAQVLAEVIRLRSGREVRLPPQFARQAVEHLLTKYCSGAGEVIEGPCGAELTGRQLAADEWALRVGHLRWAPKFLPIASRHHLGHIVLVFPKHSLIVSAAHAKWVLRALEDVKPEELDAEGRPQPWVLPKPKLESLAAEAGEDDVVVTDASEPLPPSEETPAPAQTFITSDEIRAWCEKLSRAAGFERLEWTLSRGSVNKLGLTTGRVWFDRNFVPRRVHLTTCPNSDLAETLATIVHELAHPLSRTHVHGDEFKRTLVELAERHWGTRWFTEARARLGERYQLVDAWMATGIRAALRAGEPTAAKAGDDGQMARVVTKIRKLRELAANQVGLPEAITATATANDLVTVYDLGSYDVRIDAGIHDQMADRWMVLEDDAFWRRNLAHSVATYCDVFSLAIAQNRRMHFFGRYSDLMVAEYLYTISAERIARECDRHMQAWRQARDRVAPGAAVRERISFCDSAVLEFQRKLDRITKEEASPAERRRGDVETEGLRASEEFARVEHEKRGKSWGSGGSKLTRNNEAGRAVGRALEVVRGLSSSGGAPKQLPGRS